MIKKLKFIHIGHHKTGSSFIQKTVLPKIETLKLLDQGKKDRVTNIQLKQALYDLCLKSQLHFDIKKVSSELKKYDFNCLSSESFLGNGSIESSSANLIRNIAERLLRLFGKTKIILVIRNQSTWLKSYYLDDIEFGYSCSFKKWIELKKSRSQLDWCKYSEIIKLYYELFGKKNVKVYLYEEIFNKTIFYSLFKSFGLTKKVLNEIDFNKKVNESFSPLTFYLQLLVNRIIGTRANYGDGYLYTKWTKKIRPFLDNVSNKIPFIDKKPNIGFKEYDKILHELYAKNNNETSKLINKNLKKYGYPS